MIQSVNHRDFQEFGVVFQEKNTLSALLNGCSVPVSCSETVVYETAADAWLGWESGMPVISLYAKTGEIRDFYLDTTVHLKAGIRFSLTALAGKATVQMASVFPPRLVQSQVSSRFSLKPRLKITRLHTLLYQHLEPGYRQKREELTVSELVYVDKGTLICDTDEDTYILNEGDILLLGKNQWVARHTDIPTGLVRIAFDAQGYEPEMLSGRSIHSPKKVVAILQQMLQEQERRDEFTGDMLIALLQSLLLTLLRNENGRRKRETVQCINSDNQIIHRAQSFIAAHITQKLTVPVVAAGAGVSASYLTALFQSHLQVSPGEYIRRVKLEYSKKLIRQGQMNFTEISQLLRYSTIHHFSRQFKQMFGMTPSEYAKSVK